MKEIEATQDSVQVAITPARDAIARVGGCVHLRVSVTPPAQKVVPDRKPVALALVIDRSGSMSSPAARSIDPGLVGAGDSDQGFPDKMSFVKEACLRLVELLVDGDVVSLVTFDDGVQVVKPMTRIDRRSRQSVATAIKGITVGGSTWVEGGIRAGYKQFTAAIRAAHNCKLILLSDGEANVGEQQPAVLGERAAGAAHNGVVTSTLGVGFDYNIALMSHLAEVGNGDFTHVASLADLDTQLREELAGAAEVMARAVSVRVGVPEAVSVGSNLNGFPEVSEAGSFTVSLGDLVRSKSFIFEMTTPVEVAGDELEVTAEVTYQDLAGVEKSTKAASTIRLVAPAEVEAYPAETKVVAQVAGMIGARAAGEAIPLYDSGDRALAVDRIKVTVDLLQRAEDAYGAMVDGVEAFADVKRTLARMTDEMEAGAMDAITSKESYMRSVRSRHSRGPATPTDIV